MKTKQSTLSAIRHVLTGLGAIAAARGYGTDVQIEQIIGALVFLISAGWGIYDEHHAENAAPATPDNVVHLTDEQFEKYIRPTLPPPAP